MSTYFYTSMRRLFTVSSLHVFVLTIAVTILASGCSLRSSQSTASYKPTTTSSKAPRGTKPYTIKGKTYYPITDARGFKESGVASWYGKDFHGKLTANGETYNMYSMTAAHKTLPFGSMVRVTNRTNGRSIIVRINDRGPFIDGRVIDLTRTGAEKLGMITSGTAPVHLEVISAPNLSPTTSTKPTASSTDKTTGSYYVQVAAVSQKSSAERVRQHVSAQGTKARMVYDSKKALWRVQAGPFASHTHATSVARNLQQHYPQNFITQQ